MDKIKTKAPFNPIKMIDDWASANSIWMLMYCTGCGAIELPPTMTSRYDMERFGIHPAGTPRQADVLLITGYLAGKTLKRVIRAYEQMQSPKYVIGFGACTINGGMYWDSYNTIKMLDMYLPVDVWLAGCMPRPETVITGLNKLSEMIKEGKAEGWKKYQENLKWYRANQRKVIKNWDMPDYNY